MPEIDVSSLVECPIGYRELRQLSQGGSVALPEFGIVLRAAVEVVADAKRVQTRVHGGVIVSRPPKKG